MSAEYDAVVVGAGPAGLACSAELCRRGLSVAVLDEQAEPGGNIYRKVTKTSSKQREILGADYTAGLELVQAFHAAGPDYLPRAHVWQVEPSGLVNLSQDGASRQLRAKQIVLSPGAMERPVPFEGWTLPGVMTCGGVSNLFKDSGLVLSRPVVIAGSGPLMWLVAEHLLALEAPVVAILDTTAPDNMWPAVSAHLLGAVRRLGYLLKGLRMIAAVKLMAAQVGVPIFSGVSELRALGHDRLEQVKARYQDQALSFEAATLLVHEGVIPNTALSRQAGCAHSWNAVQRYWHPAVDADGRTSQSTLFVAGDSAFVHGAKSAELKGRRTALRIAKQLGAIDEAQYGAQVGALRQELQLELCPRPLIDALYAPRADLYSIADDVTVCRCEGLTAKAIRDTVSQGFSDHNEIKSLLRCGMGPCQGRMCGSALLELVAAASGVAVTDTRPLRQRPPIKPVSLEELANAELDSDEG